MNTFTTSVKLFTLSAVILLAGTAYGQVLGPNDRSGGLPELRPGQASTVEREAQKRQRDMDNARRATNDADPRLTQDQPNSSLFFGDLPAERKLALIRLEERAALKDDLAALTAAPDYYAKYAAALKDHKTGLARIYPDNKCFTAEQTISVERAEKCADAVPLMGDGSYYSFRLKSNLNQRIRSGSAVMAKADRADIHFAGGRFVAGGEYVQGLIAEITGADFEALDKNSAELKFLKDYKAKSDLKNIAEQKAALRSGVQLGGLTYSDSVAAKAGAVYVLRSIAYQFYAPGRGVSPDELRLLYSVVDNVDLRADVTVAFKIVGQEKDGSLIILWKELSKKDSPLLRGLFR